MLSISFFAHKTLISPPYIDLGVESLTGYKTIKDAPGSGTAGIWDGYSDQLEDDIYVLGKRALSSERRFHGWIDFEDKTPVTWNCTIDSTR